MPCVCWWHTATCERVVSTTMSKRC